MTLDDKAITVIQVAEMLGTSEAKVLGLINSGELEATNINLKADAQRPHWRILASSVGKFMAKNRHVVATQAPTRRSRKVAAKDYFAN